MLYINHTERTEPSACPLPRRAATERAKQKRGMTMARGGGGGGGGGCRCNLSLPLLLVLVATLTVAARAAWVEDYPSGVPCGVTIPVEQCHPGDSAANRACRDVCHYGGCRRGGRCVSLDLASARGRGCHCKG